MIQKLWTLRAALLLLLVAAVGCSGPGGNIQQSPEENLLQEVQELLRTSTRPNGQGPTKLADIAKHQSMYPRAYEAIKSGKVVVLWGGGLKGEGQIAQGGGDVVAYDKDVPTNGGYVLLSSGQIKKMTADEFNAAPKAGKK
jgi:hypothetical protein